MRHGEKMKDSQFVSIDHLAQLAGRDARTILRELKRGHLPGDKVGGKWLIREDHADEWLRRYNEPGAHTPVEIRRNERKFLASKWQERAPGVFERNAYGMFVRVWHDKERGWSFLLRASRRERLPAQCEGNYKSSDAAMSAAYHALLRVSATEVL
jgi:excisionase family DNA binding protein